MRKTSSVESFKQVNTFQSLRKSLLENLSSPHLDKPLAYWALSGDRRLPLAFLGHTLRDLLNLSFEELAATPGIGQKKIGSLLKLLARAAKTKTSDGSPLAIDPAPETQQVNARNSRTRVDFDSDFVSESHWEQWRETVRRYGLEAEKLGRLAPSLQELPTVIWDKPLSEYLDYTVAEMRQLKTHGEKRVRVILKVFHSIDSVLGGAKVASHLTVDLVPKFLAPIESWVVKSLDNPEISSMASVRQNLAVPLVRQVQIDCGPTITRLVEGRLGIHGAAQSIKAQSKKMKVTRARLYQLLEQCQQAIALRWPHGRFLLQLLASKVAALHPAPDGLAMLQSIADLFFPPDTPKFRQTQTA
jgi:hypothetical protein